MGCDVFRKAKHHKYRFKLKYMFFKVHYSSQSSSPPHYSLFLHTHTHGSSSSSPASRTCTFTRLTLCCCKPCNCISSVFHSALPVTHLQYVDCIRFRSAKSQYFANFPRVNRCTRCCNYTGRSRLLLFRKNKFPISSFSYSTGRWFFKMAITQNRQLENHFAVCFKFINYKMLVTVLESLWILCGTVVVVFIIRRLLPHPLFHSCDWCLLYSGKKGSAWLEFLWLCLEWVYGL